MISTKGRYSLRVMVDLAQFPFGKKVPLKEIAKRQNISYKYIQKIIPDLVANNLLCATSGKNGGYSLTKKPKDYNIYEILLASGEEFAAVACLKDKPNKCKRYNICKTVALWEDYDKRNREYFSNISLASLLKGN